jgi:hypothetical protein
MVKRRPCGFYGLSLSRDQFNDREDAIIGGSQHQ